MNVSNLFYRRVRNFFLYSAEAAETALTAHFEYNITRSACCRISHHQYNDTITSLLDHQITIKRYKSHYTIIGTSEINIFTSFITL